MGVAVPSIEDLHKQRELEAKANPALADVPDKFKKFFSIMTPKDQQAGKMDISKSARPEELAALKKSGIWDGVSPLPLDVANILKNINKSDSEVIEDMSQLTGPSVEDIKEVPYDEAPADMQKAFQDIQTKFGRANPVIFDSRKKAAAPVVQPAANVKTMTLQELAQAKAATPVKTVAEQPKKEEATTAPTTTQESPSAPPVCPRCAWDLKIPYPVKPTQEDIRNRIISLASAVQGGDGRFRKKYSLFGGTVVLHFRELTTEGSLIFQAEKTVALSADSNKNTLEQMYSIDRIQFRRHCCGLEKVERAGHTTEVPELKLVVEQYGGNVEEALQKMEQYVREECYSNESLILAGGRSWVEFENLVNALWSDQSFYSGTP